MTALWIGTRGIREFPDIHSGSAENNVQKAFQKSGGL